MNAAHLDGGTRGHGRAADTCDRPTPLPYPPPPPYPLPAANQAVGGTVLSTHPRGPGPVLTPLAVKLMAKKGTDGAFTAQQTAFRAGQPPVPLATGGPPMLQFGVGMAQGYSASSYPPPPPALPGPWSSRVISYSPPHPSTCSDMGESPPRQAARSPPSHSFMPGEGSMRAGLAVGASGSASSVPVMPLGVISASLLPMGGSQGRHGGTASTGGEGQARGRKRPASPNEEGPVADVGKAAPGSEVERFVEMNAAIERATDRRESLGPRELATLLNIHGDVELHHAHIERPQSVPDHVLSTIVTLPIKSWPSCGLTPQRRILLCLDGDQSRLLFRTPPREDVFVIFCIGRELSKSRLPDSPVLQQLIQRQQIITACSGRYKEAADGWANSLVSSAARYCRAMGMHEVVFLFSSSDKAFPGMAKQLAADGLLARSVHAHCNTELAVQSGRALLERAKEYNFFAAHAHPPDPHGKRRRLSSGDAEEEDHTVDLALEEDVGQVQEVTLGLPRAMIEMALRQGMSVQDIITAHLETVDTQRRQRGAASDTKPKAAPVAIAVGAASEPAAPSVPTPQGRGIFEGGWGEEAERDDAPGRSGWGEGKGKGRRSTGSNGGKKKKKQKQGQQQPGKHKGKPGEQGKLSKKAKRAKRALKKAAKKAMAKRRSIVDLTLDDDSESSGEEEWDDREDHDEEEEEEEEEEDNDDDVKMGLSDTSDEEGGKGDTEAGGSGDLEDWEVEDEAPAKQEKQTEPKAQQQEREVIELD